MPLQSLPRRPFVAPREDKSPLNWRRGLFRIWLLISAAWIMAWSIYLVMQYIQGGLRTSADFLVVPIVLLGPPVAVWLLGMAARWAFHGFVVEDSSSTS